MDHTTHYGNRKFYFFTVVYVWTIDKCKPDPYNNRLPSVPFNMKILLALFTAAAASAQTTVPIDLIVNWPPPQLISEKYGPLPKWAMFGEVTGCNQGPAGLTYGEGDVIALLRLQANLQAFSIQDAISLVSNSQSGSKWNVAKTWLGSVANSAVESKAAGLIGGGNKTGVAIVTGAELVKIFLPNLQGVLSLKQVVAYSRDGLQPVMHLPAGRCTIPYSVLFAVPGPNPATSTPLTIHAAVQSDK